MTWGSWGKNLSTSQMNTLIHHCLDNGITSFDHADIYGGYTTEADFGKAYKQSNIKREDVQFISKCGIQYLTENRNNKVKHYDYRAEYIIWSVENSLKNLQTDYLDLLLLHRPSPLMQPVEISKAITLLMESGKIKDFGVSNFTPSQTELIASTVTISVNQIEFSITQHEAMHNGSLDQMTLNNITPMAWSPLGSVFKTKGEQSERILNQLEPLTEKYNASISQLLLAWILKHPAGIHPVFGTTDNTRITNAARAANITLDLEDWFLILVASQGHKVP